MKKLMLIVAFAAVFALGWGVRSWTAHRGMCGRGHGDHAMMCGKHGGGHGGHHGMVGCGKSGAGCCKKMDDLDCCEKTDCVKSGKLDSTEITVSGHGDRDGDKECCKKMDDEKK